MNITSQLNYKYLFTSFSCALVTTILVYFLNKNSLVISFDSWSYWEAATSIAQGTGYKSLLGKSIVAWPPLFSLYLSIWTGTDKYLSLAEIKTSILSLAFMCAFVWSMLINSEFKEKLYIVLVSNIFIIFAIPQLYTSLLSETLWFPLVGCLFLIISLKKNSSFAKESTIYNISFSFMIFLCLMTRNSSVILGPLFLFLFT
ncbi:MULTISPECIES: hypothetical protein [unclassified Synechocystis]|uniref:hypothetical protein n=1 Tax=unclassified Synechocystis TaxID=2640012 RepID=UPI0011876569|nr:MULTISPECIES: hypothetical protein [unclassified Synechocystis]MCT0253969.1 hypothetical protein [Synechocystis sp. CS-94]